MTTVVTTPTTPPRRPRGVGSAGAARAREVAAELDALVRADAERGVA